MTATEELYKELKERLGDIPEKNKVLGITMGLIEKYRSRMFNELYNKLVEPLTKEESDE